MKKKEQQPWAPPAEHRGIGLRTVDKNYRAYGGFRWPIGTGYCEAPDFSDKKECGGGLHLLADGWGDFNLLSWDLTAIAQVCEYDKREAVDIDGQKIKVPRCNVIKTGCLGILLAEVAVNTEVMRKNCEAIIATTHGSPNTASGTRGTAAASGDGGTAAASGYGGTAAASGYGGTAAAMGLDGRAQAGVEGVIAIAWHDGNRKRITVGYIGEDGIVANTWYRCDANGKLITA